MEQSRYADIIKNLTAAANHVNEVGEEGAEQQQQEVVDGLVSLLDAPDALTSEQRQHLFAVLVPLLQHDKPLLGRVFFDIFHNLLGFLPCPETHQACTQILKDMAATCNPREMWIVCTEALGRPQPTTTKVFVLGILAQGTYRIRKRSMSVWP